MTFDGLFAELADVGRAPSGGYRRFAWGAADLAMREWFVGAAEARGLDVVTDRCGNLWAWWGSSEKPGLVVGSHLDSVPDGGAYDGPLGVVSGFAALDSLRHEGFRPSRPVGIAAFADEEGARFGLACAGSRLLTGAAVDLARTDADGVAMAEAMSRAGVDVEHVGRDDEALARVGAYVELHVEQGRALDVPVGVGTSIVAHGRWRLDLPGRADHAGTTRFADRDDPMLRLAAVIAAARTEAERRDCVATVGKVRVEPNGVNAIPSLVSAWLDARGDAARDVAAAVAAAGGVEAVCESWTDEVSFDAPLSHRLADLLGGVPQLPTGAGHDAGILAAAGVPAAMLFVRNPTGVSHSPGEHADRDDCLAGVTALAALIEHLA